MHSYPLWLLLFSTPPLALIWIFKFQSLMKYKLVLALTIIGCLAIAVPWDILSVNDHIWYFSEPYILGVWLFGLPIEEYIYITFVALLSSSVTVLLWEQYGVKK